MMQKNKRALSKMKWLVVFPLFFYCLSSQAVTVGGSFSDWYWGSEGTMVDFNFTEIVFDGAEKIFYDGKVECNGRYKCHLRVVAATPMGWSYYFDSRAINTGSENKKYTVDELNQAVKAVLPFSNKVYFPNNDPGCVILEFDTGWNSVKLASSCEGTLPPMPPPPSVPLVCKVSQFSSDTVDFGMIGQGETASRSVIASLSCDGARATKGKARLRFTDIARSGADSIMLRETQSGMEIKARLSVGSETGSNEKLIDVMTGYAADVPIFVRLDNNATRDKFGHFSGNALLLFEVL